MPPTITKANVTAFLAGTDGKAPVEAMEKHFACDKPGKKLRLTKVLLRLEDEGVATRFSGDVWQHARHAEKAAMESLPKA